MARVTARTVLGAAGVSCALGYIALTEYRLREAASASESQAEAWRDEIRQMVRSQGELRGAVARTSLELRRDQFARSETDTRAGSQRRGEHDVDEPEAPTAEEIEAAAREHDQRERDLITEAYVQLDRIIENESVDEAWSDTVQAAVEAFAERQGGSVDAMKCGGAYCSFTIPVAQRAVYGLLPGDLGANVEYIGFQPLDDERFTVFLARKAADFGALKQALR